MYYILLCFLMVFLSSILFFIGFSIIENSDNLEKIFGIIFIVFGLYNVLDWSIIVINYIFNKKEVAD